jgi:TetR/AcrR family transcriptional regulator, transcriptional repressor for nem operon
LPETPAEPRAGVRSPKRDRLVLAARLLVHEQGVERTTLADIASAADVPVGNIYYYFKTKDDLLKAVIDSYRQDHEKLIAALNQGPTPGESLHKLVDTWMDQSATVARHGCPQGSLCSELNKREGDLASISAATLEMLMSWAETQFRALGRSDARELSVALIASYQGISVLANTLRDPEIMRAEGRRLKRWIDTLIG